ncbi:MAG: radical SAM protein [Pseudomonadota bacterium]
MPIPIVNIAKMATAAVGHRLLGRRVPLNLMLALTDRCTGNCRYCQLPARGAPEMSTDEILRLLTEAAAAGCQRVGLWGGEPLLRDDIGDIIAHARKAGLFVTVDTNGHLVPRHTAALKVANHLNISLDGDEASHDANRGPGSWSRAMAGIGHARSLGLPFWTITVLTKHNVGQVEWLLDTARDMGFLTTFQVLHHNEEIGCNEGLYADDDDLRAAARRILARKDAGAPVASSRRYLQLLATWPDYGINRLQALPGYPSCLAGRLYCNVDVDGSLYVCSLFVDEVKAPNVRELGFQGAFDALDLPDCNACLGACFTEYNLLYSLDIPTGLNWVKALIK